MANALGQVIGLHLSEKHNFSKENRDTLNLIEGKGVRGDCHFGEKVQHLSRVAANPDQPNLRQVHLIHSELFDDLKKYGFKIKPGDLGENILTINIDLLSLPTNTLLYVGKDAILKVTGLRNPCKQIEKFCPGLLKKLVYKNNRSELVRLAGVMSIVLKSGLISVNDHINILIPPKPHQILDRV